MKFQELLDSTTEHFGSFREGTHFFISSASITRVIQQPTDTDTYTYTYTDTDTVIVILAQTILNLNHEIMYN